MDVFKYNNFKNYSHHFSDKTILLLGEFDFFHKGHEQLFRAATKAKKSQKIGILLIIKEKISPLSVEDKLDILAKIGFDFVVVCDFNFDFKNTEGDVFLQNVINNFAVDFFVSGKDFKFGKGAKYSSGNLISFKEGSLIVEILQKNNLKISSSLIKESIRYGEFKLINELLVIPYEIYVKNISSFKINQQDNISLIHPGIYYCNFLINDIWTPCMMHININKEISFHFMEKNITIELEKISISKIQIIESMRIISNSRVDLIDNKDWENFENIEKIKYLKKESYE